MIDINNHILPGSENGAKHMEESLAIAKAAVQHGVDTIIAAPTYVDGELANSSLHIKEKVTKLNARLQAESIPLEVLPAQKARIHSQMTESQYRQSLLPVNENSNYILVELPSDELPDNIRNILFSLQIENLVPIIVHPELNKYIQENPEEIYKEVKHGALVQIAADSILGKNGAKAKKLANQLIEFNLAHFVASGHHRDRKPAFCLKQAYKQIEKSHNSDTAFYLEDNLQLLIENESIIGGEPQRIKVKKLLGFL